MADVAQPTGSDGSSQSQPAAKGAGLTVPDDIQKKFPDLLKLIKGSESMNDEERQYWINILPIMTPEQIQNLHDILDNEKKQLAAIDAKYQSEIQKIGQTEVSKQAEEDRRKKRQDRASKEATHQQQESQHAEDVLKQIDQI